MSDHIMSSWELREALMDEKATKFNCGITSVDETLEGFEPGELITLSGPTKHGKTTVFQMFISVWGQTYIIHFTNITKCIL